MAKFEDRQMFTADHIDKEKSFWGKLCGQLRQSLSHGQR